MAPRFVQKPTEFVEGDALVVVCEVLGDPKPEVRGKQKTKQYEYLTLVAI